MKFESLTVENIMGCEYSIDFDSGYTVIIGNNRQGKTLTARQIMLALYGTGSREKDLHDSWKLRSDELLPHSEKGKVELIFSVDDRRFKIVREFGRVKTAEMFIEKDGSWKLTHRTDNDVKMGLEEDAGITPGLMNIVMSNEQNLIGTISYDEKLQTNVWDGWRWRTEIIRGNIDKAGNKCGNAEGKLNQVITEASGSIESIVENWSTEEIFTQEELDERISSQKLEEKLQSIKKGIGECKAKISHYRAFHEGLIRNDDLENKKVIENIVNLCKEKKKYLDEKKEIDDLSNLCKNYSKTLGEVNKKGGEDGIRVSIGELQDEEKKLTSAKGLQKRKTKPVKAECNIFPPEHGEGLIVEIPDKIATSFKYEEIKTGGIAVPYDSNKEGKIVGDIKQLNELSQQFDEQKGKLKTKKDNLRTLVGGKKDELDERQKRLDQQETILKSDKKHYTEAYDKIVETEKMVKRLKTAKVWFRKINDSLSAEESLKKIRSQTVAFINRIYESIYGWDINVKLEDDEKIVVTDSQGNIRSHPSGSEIHIMGLAWRWMIARGFDLPLVLDELDVLLDEKNFDRTKRLIEEEMDRQTVILTLKETLKELPGRIYRIVREEDVSSIEEIK